MEEEVMGKQVQERDLDPEQASVSGAEHTGHDFRNCIQTEWGYLYLLLTPGGHWLYSWYLETREWCSRWS